MNKEGNPDAEKKNEKARNVEKIIANTQLPKNIRLILGINYYNKNQMI